jgi:fumarate hydratase subunit alpha
MRKVESDVIKNKIKDLFIEANFYIEEEVLESLKKAYNNENDERAKFVLKTIIENDKIAAEEKIPLCQDTGMAVVFAEIGNNIEVIGDTLEAAVNEGVKAAYKEGYLRKSVVDDPLFERINTKDNTPAVVHIQLVEGDEIKLTAAPKGFGSENMSKIKMMKPADGVEGVKDFVLKVVKEAGPNPCPPIIVGIGIGGTFEKAAVISKKALTRNINSHNSNENYKKLEIELLKEINSLGIGPGGFGGKTTCLGVNIEYFPTHIASLPVAVNICCHAYRHKSIVI